MLKKLDIYGDKFRMNVDGKETIKTKLGSYLTIFTGLLVIIAAWFLSNDIVYRKNPNYFVETELLDYYPLIQLTNKTYPLSMIVADIEGNIVKNSSLFDLEVSLIKVVSLSHG